MTLKPSTADDKDKQYVYLKVKLHLSDQYPNKAPDFEFAASRGLAEEHLTQLLSCLHELADSRLGQNMLYDLLVCIQDSLTEANVPHGPCLICLDTFDDSLPFRKTECFHYFHTECLQRCVGESLETIKEEYEEWLLEDPHTRGAFEGKVRCPVCRLPILYESFYVKLHEVKEQQSTSFQVTPELRAWQEKMAALRERQMRRAEGTEEETATEESIEPQSHAVVMNETGQAEVKQDKDESKVLKVVNGSIDQVLPSQLQSESAKRQQDDQDLESCPIDTSTRPKFKDAPKIRRRVQKEHETGRRRDQWREQEDEVRTYRDHKRTYRDRDQMFRDRVKKHRDEIRKEQNEQRVHGGEEGMSKDSEQTVEEEEGAAQNVYGENQTSEHLNEFVNQSQVHDEDSRDAQDGQLHLNEKPRNSHHKTAGKNRHYEKPRFYDARQRHFERQRSQNDENSGDKEGKVKEDLVVAREEQDGVMENRTDETSESTQTSNAQYHVRTQAESSYDDHVHHQHQRRHPGSFHNDSYRGNSYHRNGPRGNKRGRGGGGWNDYYQGRPRGQKRHDRFAEETRYEEDEHGETNLARGGRGGKKSFQGRSHASQQHQESCLDDGKHPRNAEDVEQRHPAGQESSQTGSWKCNEDVQEQSESDYRHGHRGHWGESRGRNRGRFHGRGNKSARHRARQDNESDSLATFGNPEGVHNIDDHANEGYEHPPDGVQSSTKQPQRVHSTRKQGHKNQLHHKHEQLCESKDFQPTRNNSEGLHSSQGNPGVQEFEQDSQSVSVEQPRYQSQKSRRWQRDSNYQGHRQPWDRTQSAGKQPHGIHSNRKQAYSGQPYRRQPLDSQGTEHESRDVQPCRTDINNVHSSKVQHEVEKQEEGGEQRKQSQKPRHWERGTTHHGNRQPPDRVQSSGKQPQNSHSARKQPHTDPHYQRQLQRETQTAINQPQNVSTARNERNGVHQGKIQPPGEGHEDGIQPNAEGQGRIQPHAGRQGKIQPCAEGHQGRIQPRAEGHQGRIQPPEDGAEREGEGTASRAQKPGRRQHQQHRNATVPRYPAEDENFSNNNSSGGEDMSPQRYSRQRQFKQTLNSPVEDNAEADFEGYSEKSMGATTNPGRNPQSGRKKVQSETPRHEDWDREVEGMTQPTFTYVPCDPHHLKTDNPAKVKKKKPRRRRRKKGAGLAGETSGCLEGLEDGQGSVDEGHALAELEETLRGESRQSKQVNRSGKLGKQSGRTGGDSTNDSCSQSGSAKDDSTEANTESGGCRVS